MTNRKMTIRDKGTSREVLLGSNIIDIRPPTKG